MADKEEINPNKRERRLARKLLVAEEAAKAEEMLKQENASMLPRKRKRVSTTARQGTCRIFLTIHEMILCIASDR